VCLFTGRASVFRLALRLLVVFVVTWRVSPSHKRQRSSECWVDLISRERSAYKQLSLLCPCHAFSWCHYAFHFCRRPVVHVRRDKSVSTPCGSADSILSERSYDCLHLFRCVPFVWHSFCSLIRRFYLHVLLEDVDAVHLLAPCSPHIWR